MGENRYEYGNLNDLAYTSSHGHERSIPRRRASSAEKAQKRYEALQAKNKAARARTQRRYLSG